jgi:hypothetical protein
LVSVTTIAAVSDTMPESGDTVMPRFAGWASAFTVHKSANTSAAYRAGRQIGVGPKAFSCVIFGKEGVEHWPWPSEFP